VSLAAGAVHPGTVALRCPAMSYGNSPGGQRGGNGGEGDSGHEQRGTGQSREGFGGRPHWGPAEFPDGAGAHQQGYGVPARGGADRAGGGYGAPPDRSGGPPPTYLSWAIIAIVGGVLFSLIGGVPTGIASAHFARQVMPRWQAGDQQGAREASTKARTWAIASTVLDVLGLIFVIYLLSTSKNGNVG
jgi:Interferon-induced transmembrane protein